MSSRARSLGFVALVVVVWLWQRESSLQKADRWDCAWHGSGWTVHDTYKYLGQERERRRCNRIDGTGSMWLNGRPREVAYRLQCTRTQVERLVRGLMVMRSDRVKSTSELFRPRTPPSRLPLVGVQESAKGLRHRIRTSARKLSDAAAISESMASTGVRSTYRSIVQRT